MLSSITLAGPTGSTASAAYYGYCPGGSASAVYYTYCPPPAPTPASLALTPATDTNPVGTPHTVTATVKSSSGDPMAGVTVRFTVSGPNGPLTGASVTNASGQAQFTYTGTHAGMDTITATAQGGTNPSATATKTWTVDCSSATLLIGFKTLAQTTVDENVSGLAEAFKATARATGTDSVLCIYIDATNKATRLVAGIYTDSAGHPRTLLTQGQNPGPLVNGAFNLVRVPSVPLANGTPYWITVLSPLGSGTLRFRDHCCGLQSATPSAPSENSAVKTLVVLPPAWTTGSIWPKDGPILGWGGG